MCRPSGQLTTRLKATLSNQSMNQHGAVVPSSRLDARAVQGCLFITSLLQLDATQLGSVAVQLYSMATSQLQVFNFKIDLKS